MCKFSAELCRGSPFINSFLRTAIILLLSLPPLWNNNGHFYFTPCRLAGWVLAAGGQRQWGPKSSGSRALMAGGVKGKQKEDQVRVVNPEEMTGHDDKQLLEVLGQK